MEKLKQFLIDTGLSRSEAEIYAFLSLNPPSSVLDISKKTKLYRSNVYGSLNMLISRGLIFELSKPKKMFTARPISSLKSYFKRKEFEVDELVKEYGNNIKNRYSIENFKESFNTELYDIN